MIIIFNNSVKRLASNWDINVKYAGSFCLYDIEEANSLFKNSTCDNRAIIITPNLLVELQKLYVIAT